MNTVTTTTTSRNPGEVAAALRNGVYRTTDCNGRALMFGFDEDVSGIYGWAAPADSETPPIAKFADDEEDAEAVAAEHIVAWLDAIEPKGSSDVR